MGRPGVGKTNLALTYVEYHRKEYPGGVFVFDAKTVRLLLVISDAVRSRDLTCYN